MPRVIVVSNRLPVTLYPEKAAPHDVEKSSGGLVSALVSLADEYEELMWIGWPGNCVTSEEDQRRMTERLRQESSNIQLIPVWLSQEDVVDFYNGFSNSSLWPLLHWMTPYARFKRSWAESYKRVNEKFADTILSVATPKDLIWVHDYHLFMVPQLLRTKRDDAAVQVGLQKAGLLQRCAPSMGVSPRGRPKDLPPMNEDEEDFASAVRPSDLPGEEVQQRSGSLPLLTPVGSFSEPMAQEAKAEFSPPARLLSMMSVCSVLAEEEEAEERAPAAESVPASFKSKTPAVDMQDFMGKRQSGVMPRRSVTQVELENKLKIAFFLHTPFPSYEVICVLPQCVDMVEGMLGADLIGFHTYSYLRHFRSCVIRLCGFTPEIDHVDHRGHRTKMGVFPIGANWRGVVEAMKSERFGKYLKEYTEQFTGKNLVLSVERLDYSKGMPQKLAAIQRYLEEAHRNAEEMQVPKTPQGQKAHSSLDVAKAGERRWRRLEDLQRRFEERKANRGLATSKGSFRRVTGQGVFEMLSRAVMGKATAPEEHSQPPLDHTKTVFLFIAVPSRQEVQEYQSIEEQVHQSISTINGRFSTLTHQPIVYIHRSVSMEELAALYARADCCLVTPLIDGMNLVAKEFVAAKDRNTKEVVPGTIVLSELAGAAQELFDAIVVNPYDEDAVADAITIGLELTRGNVLDEESRWEVTDKMRDSIRDNDAVAWAKKLLAELQEPMGPRIARTEETSMQLLRDSMAYGFFESNPGMKALFLDYDGTLREFESRPEDALPSDEAKEIFQGLNSRQDLKVFIVSGRPKGFLEAVFSVYRSFTLIAEHGFVKRGPETGHEWRQFNPFTCTEWMQKVLPIMQHFERCTPGASIEKKSSAIVWHYRECDEEYGQFKAKELTHQLALSLGNMPCQISQGNKIVEVASLQVKKGLVVRSACLEREAAGQAPFAEVLCIGDDLTDESMFTDAPKGSTTVKVGQGETHAQFRLPTPTDVRRFLKIIVNQKLPETPHRPVSCDDMRQIFKSFDDRTGPGRVHDEGPDPLDSLPEHETDEVL